MKLSSKFIFLIIILFVAVKSFFLSPNIWWDSAVYVGIGKYMLSLGKVGLWESSRPLVWPFILGLGWKLGLNAVIFSKILSVLFVIGSLYLTYLIGEDVFNEKIALIATLFLAFSPTLFFNSDIGLSGIPATFFGLLAVYCFLKKKLFFVGLFLGLAFMTRFLHLIIALGVVFILVFYYKRIKPDRRGLMVFAGGFLIPVMPYLILNLYLYHNVFYPFILQSTLTKYTGWMWWEPISFYFLNLLKENFLVVFGVIGMILIFRKTNYKKSLILALFLLFFVFYNLMVHKEMRFAVTFLPYLYLIASFGLVHSFDSIKNRRLVLTVTILLLCLWAYQGFSQYGGEEKIDYYDTFWEYSDKADGKLWVTSPIFIVNSDVRASELIYYPMSDAERFKKLTNNLDDAEHLLINTCDIPCVPHDPDCEAEKQGFIGAVKDKFKKVYSDKFLDCELYIFEK
ncbi:glycosyltransferase family 39 protein [Candidatus Woesearchaeota archaeon]|nr:glycosyltransferase family 39 protein [Candidatus Woesearchaeota archaeon]